MNTGRGLTMKELTLEEIQEYELGCLVYFDKICRKYGLRYSLTYGTLIGALRHKGFIPWDDDIDVLMMRSDYEKLSKIFLDNIEKDDVYEFINEKNSKQYHYTIGRIIDKRTKVLFLSNEGDVDNMGLYIDVFPVDYIPESCFVRKLINYLMMIVIVGLYVNTCKVKSYEASSCWKSMLKHILFPLLCLVGEENIYRLYYMMLKLLPPSSKYVDDLWNRAYLIDASIESEWFDDLCTYEFEGHAFYAFKKADIFLRNYYGDYMQYPPVNERIPNHNYKAFLISKVEK